MRVGALDLGSNSLLLTIAENSRILVDEGHVTGLSKGLSQGGLITPEAFERASKVLQKYKSLLDEFKPDVVKAVSTEALRKATNGEEIRKKLEAVLGHPIELITGEREAELSFWSVQKEHPSVKELKAVFDIGGASTEVCLGDENGIIKRVSLKTGSVTLSEKFSLHDQSNPEAAIDFVKAKIAEVEWLQNPPTCVGVGVAGTMTSLIAMEKKLTTYSRESVHLQKISSNQVNRWLRDVTGMSNEERKKIPGLQPERADVFGGGMSILYALTTTFQWNEVTCMDSGVRFGLIYEIMSQ